jgi:5-methyltetrahydrofolate--homocysteine methyltransferase
MSAEAAKAAFEQVKAALPAGSGNGPAVVLATVKGDIHDIGKNIVKVLLENYGYRVIDLGKDVPPQTVADAGARLQEAILRGLSGEAGKAAAEALQGTEPLSLVQQHIVPALDTVGRAFEEKRLFLPQLLMSAEAAKAAFEQVKAALPAGSGNGPALVLATVKGDIHDIGKNIVKVLLENYGYRVIDLGKDVPPQIVADAVKEHHIKLVGLSALMTTTVPAMAGTIALLRETAPDCKVVVGGAVLTQEYADQIGADRYALGAMDTVRYAEEILGKA